MGTLSSTRNQAGVSMIEVLVTIIILLVGLLGLAGLQAQSQRSEMESYQRVQALILLQDMAGRINANRQVASCYAVTGSGGSPYFGTSATATAACTAGTAEQQTRAVQDMQEWNNLIAGSAETSGGNNIGAMIGARGCVNYDATTQSYLITVVWQGLGQTTAPPSGLNCATGLYGNEAQRRAVSLIVRIATLS